MVDHDNVEVLASKVHCERGEAPPVTPLQVFGTMNSLWLVSIPPSLNIGKKVRQTV